MRGLVLGISVFLFLSACQTTGNYYGEFKEIPIRQAMLGVDAFDEGNMKPKVQQKEGRGVKQEWWSWLGGEMVIYKTYSNYYMARNASDPHVFLKNQEMWRMLKFYGVKFGLEDVKKAKGRNNKLYTYAIGESADGKKYCFVASKGIGDSTDGNGPAANLSMYMCSLVNKGTKEEITEKGFKFLSGVYLNG